MPGIITELLEKIQGIFLKAFEEWFNKLTPLGKLIVAVTVGLCALAVYYSGSVIRFIVIAAYIPQIAGMYTPISTPNENNGLPFSKNVREIIIATQQRLLAAEAQDIYRISDGSFTPWSVSQAISALNFAGNETNKSKSTEFINSGAVHGCECWSELPNGIKDFRLPLVSGWVMSAFADLKMPVSGGVIDTLLKDQNKHGWWSTYPVNDSLEYASTYTTAWAVIGLVKQYEAKLVPAGKSEKVHDAIIRGAEWLLSVRNGAIWKNYPFLSKGGEDSESISGVTIHAINLAFHQNVHDINLIWLDKLPDRVISASDGEHPYVEIVTPSGVAFDHFVQLKLPWMIVGAVDAFWSGNIWQKAKALKWIEDNLSNESLSASDGQNNWWRAEILISLNYALMSRKT